MISALIHARYRAFINTGRLLRRQSALKLAVVSIFGLGLFLFLGGLFYEGFRFLHTLGGAGVMIIHRLFALFFFGLGVILLFSSLVTTYATLYRAPEVSALLPRPVGHGVLTLYKLIESAVYSSWAFFLIIIPFVGAYALHQQLSPLFGAGTVLFSIPFVMIYSFLGSIVCILMVRFLPSGRALLLLAGGAAGLLIAWILRSLWTPIGPVEDGTLVLARLVPGMRVSSHPMWPSWWIAEGIMAVARGDHVRGALLWSLMMSSALALGVCAEGLGRRLFYPGWLKIAAGGRARTGAPRRWDGLGRLLLGFAPAAPRALLMKDIRVFLRDPVQYTQALVFFGLLALYFVNLRQLNYDDLPDSWRRVIGFLNLFSVAAVTCSLSARFVYPQMSMEGHAIWLTGLSPLDPRRMLRAKFVLSAVMLSLTSASLVGLSAWMLRMDPALLAASLVVIISISLVVTALALGLGAVFMDPRERNPAAIVSSFGGTLNLVLSLLFTLAILIGFAGALHLLPFHRWSPVADRAATVGLFGVLVAATTAGIMLPLRYGRRRLEQMDV